MAQTLGLEFWITVEEPSTSQVPPSEVLRLDLKLVAQVTGNISEDYCIVFFFHIPGSNTISDEGSA